MGEPNDDYFERLREAMDPANQPDPTPISRLDRKAVLASHQDAITREAELDRRREVRTRKLVCGAGKHFAERIPLDQLERTTLEPKVGGLRLNEAARGKILICRIITKCVRLAAVEFVVEDVKGHVVPIHLYHIPARLAGDALNARYPVGAMLAIREPNLRSSRDRFFVRVDSPSDLVRLYPSSVSDITWSSNLPHPIKGKTATEFKDEGNHLFLKKSYPQALDAYSFALDAAPKAGRLFVVILSNRAQVNLSLGFPGAALRDCDTALLDPNIDDPSFANLKEKLLYRAASAQYELGRLTSCQGTCAKLLKHAPTSQDAIRLEVRARAGVVSQELGTYDWVKLLDDSLRFDAIDAADFTGGDLMEVAVIEGKGRGLVATRDIERGQCLLFAAPITMGRGDPTRLSYAVGANLFTNTMDPYAHNDLVALLVERIIDDPANYSRLLELTGGRDFPPPSQDPIPLPSSSAPLSIDTSLLEGIATFNAFHTEPIAPKTVSVSLEEERLNNIHAPSSIYHIPSFMNHSCLGNITYTFIGSHIMFRARRDIKKGEELVDSYVDSLESLYSRRNKLEKHGFVCKCELCFLDEQDGPARLKWREKLVEELDLLTDRIHGARKEDAVPHIQSIQTFIENINATYNPKRGKLRPALYHGHRLLAQCYATMNRHIEAQLTELKGLECLGAEVLGNEVHGFPKLGDANAILSCLFIAKQSKAMGKMDACRFVRSTSSDGILELTLLGLHNRSFIQLAQKWEASFSSETLFRFRYGEWAEKNGLDLDM